MANYVYHQIICTEDFLQKYLLDYYPFYENKKLDSPYISFNKLTNVKDIREYSNLYGVYIYYGYGFSYLKRDDNKFVVKFATRWEYPISAIQKAMELDHTVEWYAMEESCIYVSKFYFQNGLMEDIALLTDDFNKWADENYDFEESLSDNDHLIWYYLPQIKQRWIPYTDKLELPKYY